MNSFARKLYQNIAKMLQEYQILSGLRLSDRRLIRRVRRKNLTYLTVNKLVQIVNTCRSIEQQQLSGLFLETGCTLGGSTIVIASLKQKDRPFLVYDVFGMVPAPTHEDTQDAHERYQKIVHGNSTGIGGDTYYGYQVNLYEKVQRNLSSFGINSDRMTVKLIKGLLHETLHLDKPVVFAHVDVDWYEPVKTSLERIFPKLVLNGSIIIDGYFDWGGCKKAVDEFLTDKTEQVVLDTSLGSLKMTKIR